MATQIDNDAKVFGERASGYAAPGVVRDSDGRVYAAHYNESNQLEVHYSDDNGANWTLDTTFTESNMDYLSMVVSENDDVFVAFCEGTTSPVNLVIKKKDGVSSTWSEVLSESVSTDTQPPVLIYNRYNNRLFLFWVTSTVLYNKYSDDKGSTWSSNNSYTSFGATICTDGDYSTVDGYMGVWISHATYKQIIIWTPSGAFSTGVDANVPNGYGIFAYDSSGNRYCGAGSTSFIRVYLNGFNVWNGPDVKLGHYSIGIDNDDNVYVFYTKTDEKCYYRKYTNETDTWSSETALTTGDGLRPACEKHPIPLSTSLHLTYFSD